MSIVQHTIIGGRANKPAVPILSIATVAAALLLAPAGAGAAVTVAVNTTADVGASPTACQGVPGDCSLRQAIDKAASGDTIDLPAGNYALTLGTLGVFESLTINGAGARSTVVTGDGVLVPFVFAGPVAATLTGVTLSGGHRVASQFLGGGAIDHSANSLTLDRVNLSGTTQETTGNTIARGGAITVRTNNAATLTITNSTLAGNSQIATANGSNQGGAIFTTGAAALTITNSTIANNTQQTGGSGGSEGSAVYAIDTPTTLRNVTVAGNSGNESLGKFGVAAFSLDSTIVAGNPGGNCDGTVTSLGHNLESANECGLAAAGDKVNTNPLLGPLLDNGGSTDTMALPAGSAAIDAGNPASCPATDQRGVARSGGCDTGAFECVPPITPDTTAPIASNLTLSPSAFAPRTRGASIAARRAKRGASVSYNLSEAATVSFTAERRVKGRKQGRKCSTKRKSGRRCTTYKVVKGSFSQADRAGANSFKFSGRINNRKLLPGSYRLVAIAADAAGNRGVAVRRAFRIVR